jgi:hypothetical protein
LRHLLRGLRAHPLEPRFPVLDHPGIHGRQTTAIYVAATLKVGAALAADRGDCDLAHTVVQSLIAA